jgi:Flp pilus assembly protein TadG
MIRRLVGRATRRLGDERGAVAVVLSLLMVPMLGFAAIAVDVGALYAERARLQTAADAAAFAVAQDCARGACGDMVGTATDVVRANDGDATSAPPVLSSAPLSVRVTGSTPVEHWFAPVIGFDSTAVSATATVGWGSPDAGTAVLPLTFSWCEFKRQTNGGLPSATTVHTINLTKSTPDDKSCTGPSGNFVPGGFGYLDTVPGSCRAASAIQTRSYSSAGNSLPSSCPPADVATWRNRTVLLPIFDEYGGTGTNAWYRVYGYAAFRLTGYDLGDHSNTGKNACQGNGSDRCVTGYFTRFVDLSEAFSYSSDAPALGTAILRLIR